MKRLWFILPLLFILSCEDKEKEPDSFVEGWIQCKRLSVTTTATDNSYNYEIIYNWDGNIYEKFDNGESMSVVEHNEYGIPIRSVNSRGQVWYNIIFDKWKISENGWINQIGDTMDVYTYIWDGLTATQQSRDNNHINNVITYNEYGLKLEQHLIHRDTGVAYDFQVWTYEDDGRRLKNHTVDGRLYHERQWNGNNFEHIMYNLSTAEPELKAIGKLNQYYLNEIMEIYSYDNGNWISLETSVYEYECPAFEQIYP